MPGTLKITNGTFGSSGAPVYVTIYSSDGETVHLENKKLAYEEKIQSVVRGGVKKLAVSNNDKRVLWLGYIPSYGQDEVIVTQHLGTNVLPDVDVSYQGHTLVNLINRTKGIGMSWTHIGLIVLLFLGGLAMYYWYKNKR